MASAGYASDDGQRPRTSPAIWGRDSSCGAYAVEIKYDLPLTPRHLAFSHLLTTNWINRLHFGEYQGRS